MSSDETRIQARTGPSEPYYGCCHSTMKALGTLTSFLSGLRVADRYGGDLWARWARSWTIVALNFIIAVIKGIEPRDQLEAMLAAQMGAIHMLTMWTSLAGSTRRTTSRNGIARNVPSTELVRALRRRSKRHPNATAVTASKGYGGTCHGKRGVERPLLATVTHGGRGSSEKLGTTS